MYDDEKLLEIREKLEQIIGQELKYWQLCQAIGEPTKTGEAKQNQLADFALVANITKLFSPTRYIITEVYDTKLLPVTGRDKFQAQMEVLILSYLKDNKYKDVYISNSKLLENLYLVSENYRFVLNDKKRMALEKATATSYENIYTSSLQAAQILKLWVDRALKKMDKKDILRYRRGFCLIRKVEDRYYTHNIPLQSDEERRVMACYKRVYENIGITGDWIPPSYKVYFNNFLNIEIKNEFGPEYMGAFKANVITISKEVGDYNLEKAKKELNAESIRRISNSKNKVFENITVGERKKMLNEIIKVPPEIYYKNIVGGKE